MKITLENSGKNLDIGFRYDRDLGNTIAYIRDIDSNFEYKGFAQLNPKDHNFNKKIGRKVALANLFSIYDIEFDYDLRTDIWNSLRKRGMRLS